MSFTARRIGTMFRHAFIMLIMISACVTAFLAGPSYGQAAPTKIVAVFNCDYQPISFWDRKTDKPSGFFVDIMDSIAGSSGLQVHYICKNGWPEIITAIENNEADLGVLLKSEEREKKLLFSTPIDMTYLSFFARSQSNADIDHVPTEGFSVGVVKGSMSHEQLKNRTDVRLQTDSSYQEGLFSLLAGRIDLFAGEDSMILKTAREAGLEDRIKKVGKPFVERERGIVVRKNNAALLEQLNRALSGFVGSPEYQRIYLKWYGSPASYWTMDRTLSAAGVLLLITISIMAFWRYQSIAALNRELIRTNSARKRVVEALTKSEANLKKAEKIAKLGSWEWNILTNELLWSDEVFRIYGADLLKDKPSYDIVVQTVAPEYRETFVKAVEDAIKHDKPFEGKYRMIGLDGVERFTHTVGEVVRDSDGRPVSMFGIVRDITSSKTAEARITESENKFHTIFENAIDGIMIADPAEKRNIEANKAICAMLGYTRDEIISLRIEDMHPKADLRRTLDLFELQRRGELSLVLDVPMLRKDGSIVYADVNATPVAINGRHCLIGIFRDTTARKQADAVLRKREKQLAESQRIAHVGSWEHNLTTGEVVWSDELFRLMGLDPDKDPADFKMFFDMIHPDDRPALKNGIEETVKTGKPFSVHYRLTLRDGATRILHAQAELIHDETGTQNILSGTGQDITERMQAEEKIRQSEQFIRNILDTVDEGFIVIDRDFRILTANKAYCDQVGGVCDAVMGKHCYEISHKSSRPCYEEGEDCAALHVFQTGLPYSVLHKHTDAKGMIMYVETKGFPIKNAEGTVTSVIETINNITEKHLLEEERLKTQKLESIGTLAGGIAHDFNNLLQGVFGYISMAKMTLGQKEKSQAMLEQAEKALHQSVNLTTQLLTFSKGGKPIKRTISLLPMIENAVKFALSGSRTTYQLQIDPGLQQVEADEGQLGQVIQNIVLNADQAMPLGGNVMINARNLSSSDASLPNELDHRDTVLISIQDSGVGIPEEYLSKIFDPYFTTKDKGSGLGLATSYSIIKNHGGAVRVQSASGKGTTFLLYLPASGKRAEAVNLRQVTAGPRKGRVLVMDDEEVIRLVAKEMLRELGHEADFADKGEDAIEAYQKARDAGRPYDVVILDLTIRGGMGGEEAVRHLREIDPGVKAVVSSGYSDDGALSSHRDQGFQVFLKKPYNIVDLQHTLDALLK